MGNAADKLVDNFTDIVSSWPMVREKDALTPGWAPVWKLLSVFPDGMHDFDHWCDDLNSTRESPRVVGIAYNVPRSTGGGELFSSWLDIDNSRVFTFPLRPGFQLIKDYHQDFKVCEKDRERELFEDTTAAAALRNGIAIKALGDFLKIEGPDYAKCSQLMFQYRPIAYKRPDNEAVWLQDCFVLQGSDHAWHDFVWRCCQGVMKQANGKNFAGDAEAYAEWKAAMPKRKPQNMLKKGAPLWEEAKPSSSTSKPTSQTKKKPSKRTPARSATTSSRRTSKTRSTASGAAQKSPSQSPARRSTKARSGQRSGKPSRAPRSRK